MGDCSSYDEMRAIDTSAALEVLAKANEFGRVIPSNISPGPFIQIAANINDLKEELSLAVSGVPRAALQAENSNTTADDGTGSHLPIKDNSLQHCNVSATTSSQMSLSIHSFRASSTTAGSQLPPIQLSSIANNISGQATVNITFNLQLPPQ